MIGSSMYLAEKMHIPTARRHALPPPQTPSPEGGFPYASRGVADNVRILANLKPGSRPWQVRDCLLVGCDHGEDFGPGPALWK